jgi:hypothetical protein
MSKRRRPIEEDRELTHLLAGSLKELREASSTLTPEERREAMEAFEIALGGEPLPDYIALGDQIRAADDEARQRLRAASEGGHFGRDDSTLVEGYLGALLIRCTENQCDHSRPGSCVLFAFPGPRILTCEACLLRFKRLLMENDANPNPYCDLCLEETEEWFEFRGVYMGVMIAGSICPSCRELLA